MRQIGGDYLYIHHETDDQGVDRAMNLILIDVTGHGIFAALTVNRIHGELDRLFGEQSLTPGQVIVALNHYFFVTLSKHGIYATALALRIDAGANELQWANAGHPPAFVIRGDGAIEMVESNTVMLGVLDDEMFACMTCQMAFGQSDRVIAYTDGAIEAADPSERMLGIEGFQQIVLAGDTGSGRLDRIGEQIKQYRQGPPRDDTLIVEAFLREGSSGDLSAAEIEVIESGRQSK
jgi:sigma-B regulation protein RsbU (phosphoserine phosphatase)